MKRTVVSLVAAVALGVMVATPASAGPPVKLKDSGPVTYDCGGLVLSGSAVSKHVEQVPYTVVGADSDAYNWKYNESLTTSLTDGLGAAYSLTETYTYNHSYKVNKPGTTTTVTDVFNWTQSLTDPAAVTTSGTFAQTYVTVNGGVQTLNATSTAFPCEVL